MYAIPDKSKKKNRQSEVKEHNPIQQNVSKSKGFLVKKEKGKKKALENIELVSQLYAILPLSLVMTLSLHEAAIL